MDYIFQPNWRKQVSLLLAGVLVTACLLPLMASGQQEMTDVDPESAPAFNSGSPLPTNGFASGALVNDSGTIYLIRGLTKIPFTNMGAFTGLGYSTKNVVKGNTANYASANYNIASAATVHPWGSWLSYQGTVYYSTSGGMAGVPNEATLTANGGDFKYVLKANEYDIAALQANPAVPPLTANDPRIYSQYPPLPTGQVPMAPETLNFGAPPPDNSGAPLNFGTPPPDNSTTTLNFGTMPVSSSTVSSSSGSLTGQMTVSGSETDYLYASTTMSAENGALNFQVTNLSQTQVAFTLTDIASGQSQSQTLNVDQSAVLFGYTLELTGIDQLTSTSGSGQVTNSLRANVVVTQNGQF